MTARIGVLGPVRIADRDAGGTPMRALLAALVLAGTGTTRSVPALADEVWGDDQPQNPKAALQTLVSRARALAGPDAIASAPGGYALGTDDTDLQSARRLRAEAEMLDDGDPDRVRLLRAALALWRGEPGAGRRQPSIGNRQPMSIRSLSAVVHACRLPHRCRAKRTKHASIRGRSSRREL